MFYSMFKVVLVLKFYCKVLFCYIRTLIWEGTGSRETLKRSFRKPSWFVSYFLCMPPSPATPHLPLLEALLLTSPILHMYCLKEKNTEIEVSERQEHVCRCSDLVVALPVCSAARSTQKAAVCRNPCIWLTVTVLGYASLCCIAPFVSSSVFLALRAFKTSPELLLQSARKH